MRVLRKVQPQLAIVDLSLPGNVLETASIINHEGLAALLLLESQKNKKKVMDLHYDDFLIIKLPVAADGVTFCCGSALSGIQTAAKTASRKYRLCDTNCRPGQLWRGLKAYSMQEFSWSEQQAYRFLPEKEHGPAPAIKELAEKICKAKCTSNGELIRRGTLVSFGDRLSSFLFWATVPWQLLDLFWELERAFFNFPI